MHVYINRNILEVQGASNQGQLKQLHHEYPAQKNQGFRGHFLKKLSAHADQKKTYIIFYKGGARKQSFIMVRGLRQHQN